MRAYELKPQFSSNLSFSFGDIVCKRRIKSVNPCLVVACEIDSLGWKLILSVFYSKNSTAKGKPKHSVVVSV